MPKIKSGKRENTATVAHHPHPILPALASETTTTMTTTTTSIFTITSEQQTTIDQTLSINQETMSEHDLKMLRDPPYKLTLSIDELLAPAKKTRKNKRPKDSNSLEKPPRPQNGWVIFRKDYEAKLRLLNPNATYKIQDISKECGVEWRSQPSEVKKYFDLLQRIAFEKHKIIAIFDFNLPQPSQYTPIEASFARQLHFHSNEFMPSTTASSLTQHQISMPEDLSIYFDTLAASLSSNELNSDYNTFVDGLGITTTHNNDLQDFTFDSLTPSISPNYTINEDATSVDTFNEIISLDQLDFFQTNSNNNNQIPIFNEFDSNNPLNCAENNNYLFAETNSKEIIDNNIDITPIDEFSFMIPYVLSHF
ncbi:1604_t:CDS:2 [Ambispora gerdemannii]|uniref:1604_t:CDS:1 n=1 Tax=Ambispora gerdemannii TaxID=144530 RepID=A0A9N9ATM0_9GLOM|nr:1604_t:CDS:2 [Ambispora gerdemannii]